VLQSGFAWGVRRSDGTFVPLVGDNGVVVVDDVTSARPGGRELARSREMITPTAAAAASRGSCDRMGDFLMSGLVAERCGLGYSTRDV